MVVLTGNLILILGAYSLSVHHSTKQGCEEFSSAAVERGPFKLSIPLFKGVTEAALYCARHSHPPNPERAKTRSCPRRAHSDRAFCEQRRTPGRSLPIFL